MKAIAVKRHWHHRKQIRLTIEKEKSEAEDPELDQKDRQQDKLIDN
jgi:hypothetical protein